MINALQSQLDGWGFHLFEQLPIDENAEFQDIMLNENTLLKSSDEEFFNKLKLESEFLDLAQTDNYFSNSLQLQENLKYFKELFGSSLEIKKRIRICIFSLDLSKKLLILTYT